MRYIGIEKTRIECMRAQMSITQMEEIYLVEKSVPRKEVSDD